MYKKQNGVSECMDYEIFIERILILVSAELGSQFSVNWHYAKKNNDTLRCGVTIEKHGEKTEGLKTAPTIYLEEYYSMYKAGYEISEIVHNIIQTYYECRHTISVSKEDFELNSVRDKICFMLVNREMNQNMLCSRPHRSFLDLAVIYYIYWFQDERGIATVPINFDLLVKWGINEEDLWELAYRNTRNIHYPSLKPMRAVLYEKTGRIYLDPAQMFVLSNVNNVYGLTSIIYGGTLQRIATILQSSYYIFPSSIHECIILISNGNEDPDALNEMVREINQNEVEEEEIVANHIYYYNMKQNKIQY